MEVDTATVAKSRGGKSRARSEWAHSRVFSSDEEEEAKGEGPKSKASLWGDNPGRPPRPTKAQGPSKKVCYFTFTWYSS